MPANVYEVIALAARYWFAFLGVLIVFRTYRWLIRDRRKKHRLLKQLPDAGMIGELVVLRGNDELNDGMLLPVPWEGTIGFVRTCDITIPLDGVARKHADFVFRKGNGLTVIPRRRRMVTIDGVEIHHRKDAQRHPLRHGSEIDIGMCTLRLNIFMGLDMAHSAKRSATVQPEQPYLPPHPMLQNNFTPPVCVQPAPLSHDYHNHAAYPPPMQPVQRNNSIFPPQSSTGVDITSIPRDLSAYERPKRQNPPVKNRHDSMHDMPDYSARWDTPSSADDFAPPPSVPSSPAASSTPRRRSRTEGRHYDT